MFKELCSLNYSYEQMKGLVGSLIISIVTVNMLAPVGVFIVLYDKLNNSYLFYWLLLHIIIAIFRLFVGNIFSKYLIKNNKEKIKKYFKYYIFIVAISGLLWGIIFFASIFQLSDVHVYFLLTIMFALTSGSIVTLGTVHIASYLFILTITIPTIIALILVENTYLGYFEILIVVTYVITIYKMEQKNKRLTKESIKSSIMLNQYMDITDKGAIISKTDLAGIITHVNDNFCNISGYSRAELIGKNHNLVRHPEVPKLTFKNMWEKIKKKLGKGLLKI